MEVQAVGMSPIHSSAGDVGILQLGYENTDMKKDMSMFHSSVLPHLQLMYVVFLLLTEHRQRDRVLLQSTHISLWEHSSHYRLIGRGVPGIPQVPIM